MPLLTGLNPNAPDHLVIAAFNSPDFQPATSEEQLMIVGAGGTELWERHWSRYDPKEHPREHPEHIRAMRLVKDLSQECQDRINQVSLHHHRLTDAGREQHEQLLQSLPQDLRENSTLQAWQNMPNKLDSFVQAHPGDWDPVFTSFETLCQDGLDLGRHLAFLALLRSDPTLLAKARHIMAQAAHRLESLATGSIPDGPLTAVRHALAPWAGITGDPADAELRTTTYIRIFLDQFLPKDRPNLPAATGVAVIALTARAVATARRQTADLLANMPKTDDRIPMTMREIADDQLSGGQPGITRRMEELLSNLDPKDTLNAFQELHDFQEALVAVAFTNRLHTGERQGPYARRLSELKRQDPQGQDMAVWTAALRDHIPPPSDPRTSADRLQELIKDRARAHLAAASESAAATAQGGWQSSTDFAPGASNYFHHHFHQGTALLDFLATTSVQACVGAVRHNPAWQNFIRKET